MIVFVVKHCSCCRCSHNLPSYDSQLTGGFRVNMNVLNLDALSDDVMDELNGHCILYNNNDDTFDANTNTNVITRNVGNDFDLTTTHDICRLANKAADTLITYLDLSRILEKIGDDPFTSNRPSVVEEYNQLNQDDMPKNVLATGIYKYFAEIKDDYNNNVRDNLTKFAKASTKYNFTIELEIADRTNENTINTYWDHHVVSCKVVNRIFLVAQHKTRRNRKHTFVVL